MTNENYLDTNATNVGIANFMQSLSSEKVMSMIATAYTQADEMMQKNKRQLNILVFGQTKERTFINILFGENLIINCINKSINECKIKDDLSIFDCFDIDKGLENITSFLNEKMQENSDKQIHIAYFIYTKDCAEESDEKICEILRKYQIPIFCVILKEDECFIDEIMQNLQFTTPQIQQINPLKIQNDDENEREKLKELIQKSCNLLPQSQRAVFATRQQCDKELEKSTMKESAKSIIDNYVNMAMASAEVPFAELPTQCAMIIHINKIYGIELCSENIVNIIVGFGSVAGVKGLMVYAQVPQNNSTNALLVKNNNTAFSSFLHHFFG